LRDAERAARGSVAMTTMQTRVPEPLTTDAPVFDIQHVTVRYGDRVAIGDITLGIGRNAITAIIGPSGCGKSTLLRCMNRMNDLVPGASIEGTLRYNGQDIYAVGVDPTEVRRRIGMVFQRPNPFPKSIYDNVAFGPRLNGVKQGIDEIVETSLRNAALWDEVKDKLRDDAYALSGGQQQRLCIARAIAVSPDVILMDEPCSALDPIATTRIEDLMSELKERYSIVIVTHNMQQAARVADMTAFLTVDVGEEGERTGRLVEYAPTREIFTTPKDKRTEDYVTGRVG
jgi:phosphate transport system ATP-binding protein